MAAVAVADLEPVDYAPTSETIRLRVLARLNGTTQTAAARLSASTKLEAIERVRRRGR